MLYRMLKFTVTIVCLLTMSKDLEGGMDWGWIPEGTPMCQ